RSPRSTHFPYTTLFRSVIHRCHDGAAGEVKFAALEPGHVVHAEHRIHRETLEQPILDHRHRAAHDLFRGLEDQVDGAVEGPRARQVLRRAEQHRAVTVVAAGVRFAFDGALVIAIDHLLHRQRVGVGAQADRLLALAAPHAGNYTR